MASAMPVNFCRTGRGQPRLNHLSCWQSSRRPWHVVCEKAMRARQRDAIVKNLLKNFFVDESGATAIEYELIAAGIALAIITLINRMGSKLSSKFGSISSSLK
ncbi:Flp pilus assembly pilin Flp [Bradyrhizobium sp. USDA 4486]